MEKLHVKYTVYLSVGIFLVLISLSAFSYAFYNFVIGQEVDNVYSTLECIDVDITSKSKALNLKSKYPLLDNKGEVEDAYTFSVKNNCDGIVDYNIILSVLDESTLENEDYLKVNLTGENILMPTTLKNLDIDEGSHLELPNVKENYILTREAFKGKDEHIYNFRMWLNGENSDIWNDEELANQKVKVKLSIVGVATDKIHYSLNKAIINSHKNIPNLETNINNLNEGLNSINDKEGKSYFFAGKNVNNNIVINDELYKIIRINGNGTIRLINTNTLNFDRSLEYTLDIFNETLDKGLVVKESFAGYNELDSILNYSGLLSEDELVNSGLHERSFIEINNNLYLSNNKYVNTNKEIKEMDDITANVKPVINIKENTRVTGKGTEKDPYQLLK